MSSNTQSATWEIKNIKVKGEPGQQPQCRTVQVTNWNTEWLGCTQFGPLTKPNSSTMWQRPCSP
jgi:hypothetical protein